MAAPTTKTPKPASKSQKRISSGAAVAIVLGAIIVIGALVAFGVSLAGGSDDGLPQTQPVEWSGTALPPHDQAENPDRAVGIEPPTLEGLSFDGSPVVVEPGGGDKMLVFVAHWCPFCQAEIPRLVEWMASGQMPEGLEVTAISTGVNKNQPNYPPSAWFEDEDWPAPVMADDGDNSAATAYGLKSYPFLVIIGDDGLVKARHSGAFSSLEDLDLWVDTSLAS